MNGNLAAIATDLGGTVALSVGPDLLAAAIRDIAGRHGVGPPPPPAADP